MFSRIMTHVSLWLADFAFLRQHECQNHASLLTIISKIHFDLLKESKEINQKSCEIQLKNWLKIFPFGLTVLLIHLFVREYAAEEYTPGHPSSPQPTPQETTPVRAALPSMSQMSGPPESPWQESTPPSVILPMSSLSSIPAQIISGLRTERGIQEWSRQ